MTIKNRIIAGALAFAISAGAINLTGLSSLAEGNPASEEKVKWTGFNEREVSFDTFDGVATTNWYTEHTGTENDPYIISSAEEFMGIAAKTATINAAADNQGVSGVTVIANDFDYLTSGTRYFLPKSLSTRDSDAWYSTSWQPAFTTSIESVDYEYETMELATDTSTVKHYYATKVTLNYKINGQLYSEDITAYAKAYYSNVSSNSPFWVIPVDDINSQYYTSNFHVCSSLSSLESRLSGIRNRWVFTASRPSNLIYVYNENAKNNNIDADDIVLGTLDDFNITLPTIEAVNPDGETITITNNDYDNYYITNAKPAVDTTVSRVSTSLSNTTTIATILTDEDNTNRANNNANLVSDEITTQSTVTSIANIPLQTKQIIAKEDGYYYWQKTDNSLAFDKDPEFYYIYVPKGTVLYTLDYKLTIPSKTQIKIDSTITDCLGNTHTETLTWNTTSYSYDYYYNFYLNINYDSTTGTLKYRPYLKVHYYQYNTSSSRYTISINSSEKNATLTCPALNVSDVYDEILNQNDAAYNFADISSELTYRGYTTTTPITRKEVIERNDYIDNVLPSLAAQAAPEPTFKNKYFKLDCDIELINVDPVFPICATGGISSAGMSADFDLNGHVIKTNSTLFGNITKYGHLHNGYIVTDTDEAGNYDNAVVYENYGTISDIEFLTNDAFVYQKSSHYRTHTLVQYNAGTIKAITSKTLTYYYTSQLAYYNIGTIADSTHLFCGNPNNEGSSTFDWRNASVNTNKGLIKNFSVLTDVNVLPTDSYTYYYNVAYNNSGEIDNLLMDIAVERGCITVCYNRSEQPVIKNSKIKVIGNDYQHLLGSGNSKSTTIVENTNFILENECDSVLSNSDTKPANLQLINCSFDAKISSEHHYNQNVFYGCTLFNCKANVTCDPEQTDTYFGLSELFDYTHMYNSSVNINGKIGSRYIYGKNTHSVNTDIYIDNITCSHTYGYAFFWGTNDSYATNSKIKIDNLNVTCDAEDGENTISYNGDGYCSGTDFIIRHASGAIPQINGYFNDCRFWFNLSDIFELSSYTGRNNAVLLDSEVYYTFDDSAQGTFHSIFSHASVNGCFVFIDAMPDAVKVNDVNLINAQITKNLTVIAPRINIDKYPKSFSITGMDYLTYADNITNYDHISTYPSNGASENVNIIANIFVPSDAILEEITAVSYSDSSSIGVINQLNALINVYNSDASDADIAVTAVTTPHINDMRYNNIVLRSNTTSAKSSLISSNTSSLSDFRSKNNTYRNALLWNCYLDLPNAQQTGTPSETANYRTPGFINVFYPLSKYNGGSSNGNTFDTHYYNNEVAATVASHIGTNLAYSRCYLPENQSAVTNYFSDDPNVVDSWNVTEGYINENLSSSDPIVWEDTTKHFDFETIPDGISYISKNAYTSGELAYLLDKGNAGARRTYEWTVIEPETHVYNSFTNEYLYTLPEITWLSDAYMPTGTLASDANLDPVFKTTINEAQDGYIEIIGIGDTTTKNGSIYTKRGAKVIKEVKSEAEDKMLIYATQKLGAATPVTIPSSSETTYDISDYKQLGIDTIITPVFKTARYITVNVTGDENGTIIPSAYVSAEGEKITLSTKTDAGYIIKNICIDGTPINETTFYMPDKDIVITGDCIAFEGGITYFSLLGTEGVIDQNAKTITVDLPKSSYVNNALPYIEYVGDYISPGMNVRQDFTNPVDYTVHYGENQSVTYTVTVNQSDYTMRIYDFVINGVHGTIDQANRIINVKLPIDTDLRSLTPDDIVYSAETISPDVNQALNFTVSQIYTLYATGMTPVNYAVNVTTADNDEAAITSYKVSGFEGDIDNDENTITLTLPKGMNVTSIVPDIITYEGRKISPSKISAVDLTNATYNVSSQSGTNREYNIIVNYMSDDEAHIDSFKLAGYDGIIDQNEKTISITIPRNVNVIGIAPDEIIYTGKSIYPSPDLIQDFTKKTQYTVVAPDNTEVTYDIIVTQPVTDAYLLEFGILGYDGVIDQENKTITVHIPYGLDISDTPPSKLIISTGASVSPSETEKQDFTKPVEYTVTSSDGIDSNTYTVTTIIDYPECEAKITEFYIDSYEGIINQSTGEILITLPYTYTVSDIANKVPAITWVGKEIVPSDNAAQNFNIPVSYTVTAIDPSIVKTYTVYTTIEDAPTEDYYNIIIATNPNGRITSTHTKATVGTAVTVTVTPNKNCQVMAFFVDGVDRMPDTSYSFNMPAHDVYVSADIAGLAPIITTSATTTTPTSIITTTSNATTTSTANITTKPQTTPKHPTPIITTSKATIATTTASSEITTSVPKITSASDNNTTPVETTPIVTTTPKTTTSPETTPVETTSVPDDDDDDDTNVNTGVLLNVIPPISALAVILLTKKKRKNK